MLFRYVPTWTESCLWTRGLSLTDDDVLLKPILGKAVARAGRLCGHDAFQGRKAALRARGRSAQLPVMTRT